MGPILGCKGDHAKTLLPRLIELQKSSISDFISVLREVFAKEPPVMSRSQAPTLPEIPAPAPPIPPPPEAYRNPPAQNNPPPLSRESSSAPPRPPKPGQRPDSPPPAPNSIHDGPPLPPLPPHMRALQSQSPPVWQPPLPLSQPNYPLHPHQSELPGLAVPRIQQHSPHQVFPQRAGFEGPISPVAPSYAQQTFSQPFPLGQPSDYPGPNAPGSFQSSQEPPRQNYQPQPAPPQARKAPVIDLLSSPLDVTLPTQTGSFSPLPAPPIPPNPEKDALLTAVSHMLVSQTKRTVETNIAAIQPLIAQNQALLDAHATLSAELEHLHTLSTIIDSNERVLRGALGEAETIMQNAAKQRRPEVDELLVCPTVVGSQLYTLVAEEKACQDTRVALGRGLDKGRVSTEIFVRNVRSLARDEFLKKALIRKVAKGMGLDERRW
jgi:ESCRT-I complex subunit TSG101